MCLLDMTLASHMNHHEFLFKVTDSKWKEKKRQGKAKGGKRRAGMACQNVPRKAGGKMTQVAVDLSGRVVLARIHCKLDSIFPSCVWGR